MSPPIARPLPRFIADSAQEARPYGDWQDRLRDAFIAECAPLESDAGALPDRGAIRFFPERAWGGRTFVPVVARASGGGSPEFFGHVSFDRGGEGEPGELVAEADFTDVTAEDNPGWRIDLNDDVVGDWKADGGRGGDVTLIWGSPLVKGALAATAELDGEVVDQAALNDGRFTLLAVDAVHGFGDDVYLEIKLWDRKLQEIAAESLYEDDEDEAPDSEPPA